ncbi:uncharacterized protein LOC113651004, partial [Tachysurus ichikawai]
MFELHSVELELEAVEKQIRDLQVKQAELRERKAMLEASRSDAHLSQMLIHEARLKMQSTTEQEAQLQGHQVPIIIALECYPSQLEELSSQLPTYIRGTYQWS